MDNKRYDRSLPKSLLRYDSPNWAPHCEGSDPHAVDYIEDVINRLLDRLDAAEAKNAELEARLAAIELQIKPIGMATIAPYAMPWENK